MKKIIMLLLLFVISSCVKQDTGFINPGEKIKVDENLYFSYTFDKKPAIGMLIVNLKLVDTSVPDSSGTKVTGYTVAGISGMPLMRGAHDSPETEFKQNRKGDYLLPVNVVMAGEWDILVKIKKGNTVIFTGTIKFNV